MSLRTIEESEQPYEIPKHWQWVTLENVVSIKRGASPRPIKDYITEDVNGIPWIKIGDTGSDKYINGTKQKITVEGAEKSVYLEKGTLILSNSMSFGRPYILNISGCVHDGWLVISPNELIDRDYLYYLFLDSKWYFKKKAVGITVDNLNSKRVYEMPTPLPPVDEQRRIAACIERLFDKLDRAKAIAQKIVDGYELRRGKIFHNAFSGKLTNSDIDGWQKLELGELSDIVGGGTPSTKNEEYYKNGNIPWIRPADLSNYPRKYISSGSQNITESGLKNSAARLIPKNSVCLSTRAPIGYVVIAENPLSTSQGFKNFLPSPIYYPEYLYWYFKGNRKLLEMNAHGTTFLELSKRRLSEIEILLPTIGEQREIAERLDSLLSKELRVKELAEKVLRNIVMMKKKILGMAFRGKLIKRAEGQGQRVEETEREE